MAADLAADLKEAEAEGASAEEVLGSSATDPRSFAASWAAERAVIPPPRLTARLPRRSLMLAAIAALTVITAVGAALVIFASPQASARMAAIHVPPPPTPVRAALTGTVWVEGGGDIVLTLPQAQGPGVEIHTVGSILLIVGIVGIILSMLFLFWSSRAGPDHWSRRRTHIDNLPIGTRTNGP